MPDKTRAELIAEAAALRAVTEERATSDRKYAIKLVEKIVFGFIALLLVAFASALIGLVVVNGE